jgi:ubiquitin C-terminal hydrolase
MDADEFFNLLMDRIEAASKGSKDEEMVKRNFGGVISSEIICKTCPHSSEREEPFFALPLPVKNKKNIEQCLQTLIQGDFLEGDNAYHCEQCDKKVNAMKRTCLKRLPNQLIIVLKRFDFDFDSMTKAKINDRCEFPFKLNLQQYSQQSIHMGEGRSPEQILPDSYFQYQLSGVVIHMGSADSGHYYSFISEREKPLSEDKKWFEFNDTIVSGIETKDIVNEGYGGDRSGA